MKHTMLVAAILAALAIPVRSQTPTPSERSQGRAQHGEHTGTACKDMMKEHAAEMRAMVRALTSNLAQLKSTLPLINDLNERSRWQSNVVMWQALADYLDQMAQRAEHLQAMSCGTMMGNAADPEHNIPATAPKPR